MVVVAEVALPIAGLESNPAVSAFLVSFSDPPHVYLPGEAAWPVRLISRIVIEAIVSIVVLRCELPRGSYGGRKR